MNPEKAAKVVSSHLQRGQVIAEYTIGSEIN
jgi:(2Fe-2S) ferredoxin